MRLQQQPCRQGDLLVADQVDVSVVLVAADADGRRVHVARPEEVVPLDGLAGDRVELDSEGDAVVDSRAGPGESEAGGDPPRQDARVEGTFGADDRLGQGGQVAGLGGVEFLGRARAGRVAAVGHGRDHGLLASLDSRVGRAVGRRSGAGVDHRRAQRPLACGFDGVEHALHLSRGRAQPVRRPDAVDPPAESLQHLLAQAVAVAGRRRRPVGRPVAFDAQQVPPGVGGVDDGEIDDEPARADLRMHRQPPRDEGVRDGLLEGRGEPARRRGVTGRLGGRGELQVPLQGRDAAGLRARQVDVLGADGREYHAAAPRAGDQHVQAPPPVVLVQRPEVHRDLPVAVAPVSDRQEDHVALVALDRFEILDEERLGAVAVEERFDRVVLAPELLDLVEDCELLGAAERADTERHVAALPGVVEHGLGDPPRLVAVGLGSAAVVDVLAVVDHRQPVLRAVGVGGGERHEVAVVEVRVGKGDQRLVPAAVVPLQPVGGQDHGAAVEDGFHVRQARDGFRGRLTRHAEEVGRRELLGVADQHELPPPGDGAERVGGFDLAGLVEDHHVEPHAVAREELRDRQRAHHEAGLELLDRVRRVGQELADRPPAALPPRLALKDAQLRTRRGLDAVERALGDDPRVQPDAGGPDRLAVQLREGDAVSLVGRPVEAAQLLPLAQGVFRPLLEELLLHRQREQLGLDAFFARRGREIRHRRLLARLQGGLVARPLEQRLRLGGHAVQTGEQVGEAHARHGPVEDSVVHLQRRGQRIPRLPPRGEAALERLGRLGELARVRIRGGQVGAARIDPPGLDEAVEIRQPGRQVRQRLPVALAPAPGGVEGVSPQLVRRFQRAADLLQAAELLHVAGQFVAPRSVSRLPSAADLQAVRPVRRSQHTRPRVPVLCAALRDAAPLAGPNDGQVVPPGHPVQSLDVPSDAVDHLPQFRGEGLPDRPVQQSPGGFGRVQRHPRRVERRTCGRQVGRFRRARQRRNAGGGVANVRSRLARRADDLLGIASRPGRHRRDSRPTPGVLARWPDAAALAAQLADEALEFVDPLAVPVGETGQVAAHVGHVAEQRQASDRLVGRHPGRPVRGVQGLDVAVQAAPETLQLLALAVRRGARRASLADDPLEFRSNRAAVRLRAVQFQAEVAQPDAVEAPLDDLQGRELLADEQHGPPRAEALGEDVGDGLALARARRAFDDETPPLSRREDCHLLAGVGVHDLAEVVRGEQFVELRRVRQGGCVFGFEHVVGAAQRADERVGQQAGLSAFVRGPSRRVEVHVHQVFREREEAQVDVVDHVPPVALSDGGPDGLQVSGDVEVAPVVGGSGQVDADLRQLAGEAGVEDGVVFQSRDLEAVSRRRPLQAHRQQHQRRQERPLRVVLVDPPQEPHGQEQQVHAALGDGRPRRLVDPQQVRLQRLIRQRRLEEQVGVPLGQLAPAIQHGRQVRLREQVVLVMFRIFVRQLGVGDRLARLARLVLRRLDGGQGGLRRIGLFVRPGRQGGKGRQRGGRRFVGELRRLRLTRRVDLLLAVEQLVLLLRQERQLPLLREQQSPDLARQLVDDLHCRSLRRAEIQQAIPRGQVEQALPRQRQLLSDPIVHQTSPRPGNTNPHVTSRRLFPRPHREARPICRAPCPVAAGRG